MVRNNYRIVNVSLKIMYITDPNFHIQETFTFGSCTMLYVLAMRL